MTHFPPPILSTGYDLLPLAPPEQFEPDRNLPLPAKRIGVEELVRVVHSDLDVIDVVNNRKLDVKKTVDFGKVGKVRVYGRVVQVSDRCYQWGLTRKLSIGRADPELFPVCSPPDQYLETEGVLIINDPDTPSTSLSSMSISTPNSHPHPPRRTPTRALSKIGVDTSILSSHFHTNTSSSTPALLSPSSSYNNPSDTLQEHRKPIHTQNLPRDLDAAQEYAPGRYPAGSGRMVRKDPEGLSVASRPEQIGRESVLVPIDLDPGKAVCVVGYLESLPTFAMDETRDNKHDPKSSTQVSHPTPKSTTTQWPPGRGSGWQEVRRRGWVVKALQVWNVPAYEPVGVGDVAGVDPDYGRRVGRMDGDRNGVKVNEVVRSEGTWGRRSGLERYD
jgi:hypothetical protein